jgi:hypothetical protein
VREPRSGGQLALRVAIFLIVAPLTIVGAFGALVLLSYLIHHFLVPGAPLSAVFFPLLGALAFGTFGAWRMRRGPRYGPSERRLEERRWL